MQYDLIGLYEMANRGVASNQYRTGFVAPTIIFERQREINLSAQQLNGLIRTNIADPQFLAAWQAWFDQWNLFYGKYQTESGKAAALFMTDELASQTEQKRLELEQFKIEYQRRVPGATPPVGFPPAPPQPPPPTSKEESKSGWTLPWWAWAAGGAAVVLGGVYVYHLVVMQKRNVGIAKELFLSKDTDRSRMLGSGDVGWHTRRDFSDSDSLVARAMSRDASTRNLFSEKSDSDLLHSYADMRDEATRRGLLR